MDRVKLVPVLYAVFQGVGLVKLERVSRLRLDVHADHLESGPVVAHRCAARATE